MGWEDGKLNSSTTFAQSIKCIIIDWDIGSARDCAEAQGGLTLRVFIDLFVLPLVTETRSIDGGSVEFLSLSKAKVFRFPFCLAFAPLSFSVALRLTCHHGC